MKTSENYGGAIMSENRKRFLRKGDVIINLDHVRVISYRQERNEIVFLLSGRENYSVALHNASRAEFERIASALKHGEARA
jgi:hypothetical protein